MIGFADPRDAFMRGRKRKATVSPR